MPLEGDPRRIDHAANIRARFLAASVALLGLGFVGAFLVGGNPAALADSFEPFLAFLVSPWMLATYALTVVFLLYGFWFAQAASSEGVKRPGIEKLLQRQRLHLVLVFAGCVLGLVAVGAWFASDLVAVARANELSQLMVVARLKAQQVDKWLYENSIDVEILGAKLQRLPLRQLEGSTDAVRIVKVLLAEVMAGNPDRVAVALFAPDGKMLVEAGQAAAGEGVAAQVVKALAEGKTGLQVVDGTAKGATYADGRLDFALPLVEGPASRRVLAILDIAVDPARELRNQIGKWPTDSPSSEVLIVRREGDSIVYVTPPRFLEQGKVAPPLLRLPLSTPNLVGSQAILGGDGAFETRDYRGVSVIGASARVKGLDWYVVVKTDTDAVMQPVHRRIVILVLVIAASIVAAGLIVVMLWREQKTGYLTYREQLDEQRAALSQHFEQLIRAARDIVVLLDPAGNIVDCNDAAVAAYGYGAEQLRTLNIRDLLPAEEMTTFERLWPEGEAPGGHLVEGVQRRHDGTTFPVEISARPVTVGNTSYRQAFIRDISQRKLLESRLRRMVRVQRGLFEANGVLLRASSEQTLFQGMCDVVVGVGGYPLAMVAMANRDPEKTVRFAAIAGTDHGYLAQTAITWGEGPRGMGPTGAAIRTGEVQVNQDFKTNARMAPWRDAALARGLQASIGLPLRKSGEVFGALTIYSDHPDAFDDDEVAMLTRFAEDISYGVSALGDRPG